MGEGQNAQGELAGFALFKGTRRFSGFGYGAVILEESNSTTFPLRFLICSNKGHLDKKRCSFKGLFTYV